MGAIVDGILHLNGTTMLWMVVGTLVTTLAAVIPGLSGTFALVLLLPFAFTIPPDAALGMLVASIAVSGTGNSLTSIFFGVPGTASGVAAIFDGHKMAKRGEGIRALSASCFASFLGGVVAALFLAAALPVMRPLVLAFGTPEFFMLTLAALVLMGYVGRGSTLKALTSAALGLMLSFVGLEVSTGTPRYAFDQLYLWNGIPLVPAMIGLFAISEMMDLLRRGGSISEANGVGEGSFAQIMQGIRDNFTHWKVLLQSSLVGIVLGLAPGLGSGAAQFVAYAQASKLSPDGKEFGTGRVEGVIAADACTNSVDGGALIPTLAFGIPGSASMAILLVAMVGIGIQPGPEVLTENVDLIWLMIAILVISNLMAAVVTVAISPWMSKVTLVKATTLAPVVIALGLFGSYATSKSLGDIWTALAFGVLGLAFKRYGYSRATLVIGLVLGILVERYYLLSMRLFGPEFLLRPAVLVIMAVMVLVIFGKPLRQALRRRRDSRVRSDSPVP